MLEQKRYMLDTNIASHILKGGHPALRQRLLSIPMVNVFVSVITEAELLRGVAKRPEAKRLSVAITEFLLRVEIRPWDSAAAKAYGALRTACENDGKSLGNLDMLIAAQSIAEGTILVTNDKAFFNIAHLLPLEDWTRPDKYQC